MPLCKKNKQTAGPTRNQGKWRQTRCGDSKVDRASITTPPPKNWRVQPLLDKHNIPAIVEAIRTLIPGSSSPPTSTTNRALNLSLSSQQSSQSSGTAALLLEGTTPVPPQSNT